MSFIAKILNRQKESNKTESSSLWNLKETFRLFNSILNANNSLLKIIGDMEEKAHGNYLFDKNYINKSLEKLYKELDTLLKGYELLCQKDSALLYNTSKIIRNDINKILGVIRILPDKFTIKYQELNRNDAFRVGSKNAQLGELRSIEGLNVPEGFAISCWAFKSFIESNHLQEKIIDLIENISISKYQNLIDISEKIRNIVLSSELPEKLSDEILQSHWTLSNKINNKRVSVRSSALGEDTQFSFAGQYKTILNVDENMLLDSYKQVIASKYSPNSIYYAISHNYNQADLAMGVGVVEMINSVKSGVVYTSDPVNPENNLMLVSSIYGQGKLLVDGIESPDIFYISKTNGKIENKVLSEKKQKLIIDETGRLKTIEISQTERDIASLTESDLVKIYLAASKIENHYASPQDIEWAIDSNKVLYILQTRPLKTYKKSSVLKVDTSEYQIKAKGGESACPGAGAGRIFFIKSNTDIGLIPAESVIVTQNPLPILIAAIKDASAFICQPNSIASHLVTVAREYGIPTIVGFKDIDIFQSGELVTVDADNCIIYSGNYPELVEQLKPEKELFDDSFSVRQLSQINEKISPLNLIEVDSDQFKIENCKTIHDITRFIHQKSIEEMFNISVELESDIQSVVMKSTIPLKIHIIDIGDEQQVADKKYIKESEIDYQHLGSFWNGVLHDGWISPPTATDVKGFLSVVATDMARGSSTKLSDRSFAVINNEYMLLSLRMGYHYSTIEAYVSEILSKNFIKIKFKDGGASFERRIRRINIISDILFSLGFEIHSKGDYLDASIYGETFESILEKLFLLGRITMLTKQMDMALNNDNEANEQKEILNVKLGIK